ncbi:AMP-binding protein [Magnetospirillum sp. SS-4]|uniref:AMP-binding protein n=1 Tax=Magnetospirillum sp. SS-4 TaxID=2681465 RepID=UPI001385DD7D|nr:AMP-binding protein [Magnetospirillum sp. SS-4]CAA7617790.1 putative non-ribosomal peptide synthetase adenylation domain protein [Magnetospirillum sp. SS-4]
MDVVGRLLDVAARHPDAPAVVEQGGTASYRDLVARAAGMAAALARFGPHPRVAILLPQGTDAYAAMFATLMAGGYYLPCNAASVPARLETILDLFRPDVVIASETGGLSLPEGCEAMPPPPPAAAPFSPRPPHRLAYVIFTSGSTGLPKGVMIPRHALNHYAAWALEAMNPGPGDRWSQHPNIGFDLSVLDVYGALCSGAALHPLQSAMDRMLPGRFVAARRLTIWNSVPSVIDMMAKAGDLTPDRMASVRLFTFCGEPLYAAQAAALLAANPAAAIHNTYGPTEATVSCTLARLNEAGPTSGSGDTVELGAAIPGMGLHLLPTDQGDELAISGPQLADGYWLDEVRTREAFRAITVDGREIRAYLTGDIVRRDAGNRLFFQHRRDTQVKIRGYRLELDEVNAAIRALGHPEAATVLVDGRLHAFVPASGGLDVDGLRRALEKRLDSHAVPGTIHPVAEMPRNANDKIDLAALRRLVQESS